MVIKVAAIKSFWYLETKLFTKTFGKSKLEEVIEINISKKHQEQCQGQGQGQEKGQGQVQNKVKY